MAFEVRALDAATWPDFVALVERSGGVWGGCWCMSFHPEGLSRTSAEVNRRAQQARVRTGGAHAALVYSGGACVGWCQYGPVDELPRIKRRKAYLAAPPTTPDWRVTCFFVDKAARWQGVAAVALAGALAAIEREGGGVVESYPEDTTNRRTSSSFLHNGTVAMFEAQGFSRDRQIGKHHWVVTRVVDGPS